MAKVKCPQCGQVIPLGEEIPNKIYCPKCNTPLKPKLDPKKPVKKVKKKVTKKQQQTSIPNPKEIQEPAEKYNTQPSTAGSDTQTDTQEENITEKYKTLEAKVEELTAEKKSWQEKYEALSKKLKETGDWKRKYEALYKDFNRLSKKREALAEKLKDYRRYFNLEKYLELKELEKNLNNLLEVLPSPKTIKKYEEETSTKINELTEILSKYDKEISELKSNLTELCSIDGSYDKEEQEVINAVKQYEAGIESRINKLLSNYEASLEDLEAKKEKVQQKIGEYESELQKLKKEATALKLKSINTHIEVYEQVLNQKREELNNLVAQISLISEKRDYFLQVRETYSKLVETKKQAEKTCSELEDLQNQLKIYSFVQKVSKLYEPNVQSEKDR